jgi:hypothetical protein
MNNTSDITAEDNPKPQVNHSNSTNAQPKTENGNSNNSNHLNSSITNIKVEKVSNEKVLDDDDQPIATLIKRKVQSNQEDDDDDKPISALIAKKVKSSKDQSDSEDDLPLAALYEKRKREGYDFSILKRLRASKSKSTIANETVKKEVKKEKNEESNKSAKSNSSNTAKTLSKNMNYSSEFYLTTSKGKILQQLLIRWWYVIEWPKLDNIGTVPPGFEALDGFPGVFVSTRVCVRYSFLLRVKINFKLHSSKIHWEILSIYEINQLVLA